MPEALRGIIAHNLMLCVIIANSATALEIREAGP